MREDRDFNGAFRSTDKESNNKSIGITRVGPFARDSERVGPKYRCPVFSKVEMSGFPFQWFKVAPALDPSPVIPSDLSFGYLSAELKSPVKIPIPESLPPESTSNQLFPV
jgi:hypothetical protein